MHPSNSERKFKDADLTPELAYLALQYALSYKGSFDAMIEAKAAVVAYGELSPGVTRMVLNCMRTDPTVPISIQELVPQSAPKLRVLLDIESPRVRKRRVQPSLPKRTRFTTSKVIPKYRLGICRSGPTRLRVLHYVADAWCEWKKYDYTNDRWFDKPIPEFRVRWACKGNYGWVTDPLLVPNEDELPGGGYCRSGCWPTERLTVLLNGRWVAARDVT